MVQRLGERQLLATYLYTVQVTIQHTVIYYEEVDIQVSLQLSQAEGVLTIPCMIFIPAIR